MCPTRKIRSLLERDWSITTGSVKYLIIGHEKSTSSIFKNLPPSSVILELILPFMVEKEDMASAEEDRE